MGLCCREGPQSMDSLQNIEIGKLCAEVKGGAKYAESGGSITKEDAVNILEPARSKLETGVTTSLKASRIQSDQLENMIGDPRDPLPIMDQGERDRNLPVRLVPYWSCGVIGVKVEDAFHFSLGKYGRPNSDGEICLYCGDKFAYFSNRNRHWEQHSNHLEIVHNFGKCDLGKEFLNKGDFREHLKLHHRVTMGKWTSELEMRCSTYGPRLSDTRSGPKFVVTSLNMPPAPQSMISVFSSKVAFKLHKCKVCDKRFRRPSLLRIHMCGHTGEMRTLIKHLPSQYVLTSNSAFTCSVEGCGRRFSGLSNLRRHETFHIGERSPRSVTPDGWVAPECKPKMFMCYTISEDLSGTTEPNGCDRFKALRSRSRKVELRNSETQRLFFRMTPFS